MIYYVVLQCEFLKSVVYVCCFSEFLKAVQPYFTWALIRELILHAPPPPPPPAISRLENDMRLKFCMVIVVIIRNSKI